MFVKSNWTITRNTLWNFKPTSIKIEGETKDLKSLSENLRDLIRYLKILLISLKILRLYINAFSDYNILLTTSLLKIKLSKNFRYPISTG